MGGAKVAIPPKYLLIPARGKTAYTLRPGRQFLLAMCNDEIVLMGTYANTTLSMYLHVRLKIFCAAKVEASSPYSGLRDCIFLASKLGLPCCEASAALAHDRSFPARPCTQKTKRSKDGTPFPSVLVLLIGAKLCGTGFAVGSLPTVLLKFPWPPKTTETPLCHKKFR